VNPRIRQSGARFSAAGTMKICPRIKSGTLAGWGFAHWASHAISDFILGQIFIVPAALNLAPDWRILGFTAAMAILTGVLFGLAPAWRATREDPNMALQH